ncbi:MAG: DMT family transporter [Clostridiales Family XIII bacterium]|jgi:undecaprenyl phosphate-alpha-L-ara4N flippase subunit ArnE|nr:DMT family transporter [Clostridiales Family XIII bacterium]
MLESLRNNKKGILLMALSAFLASFGQMFWKMYHTEGLWALAIGFILYACGALLMIVAYKYGKLSVLQPMICLSYVFAIFISVFILKETMTPLRFAGILVVIFGVVMIGGGDEKEESQ